MSKTTKLEMKLPPADDLFSTEEQRQEAKLPSIYNIPLAQIDDFPDHPYRVKDRPYSRRRGTPQLHGILG